MIKGLQYIMGQFKAWSAIWKFSNVRESIQSSKWLDWLLFLHWMTESWNCFSNSTPVFSHQPCKSKGLNWPLWVFWGSSLIVTQCSHNGAVWGEHCLQNVCIHVYCRKGLSIRAVKCNRFIILEDIAFYFGFVHFQLSHVKQHDFV